MTSPSKSGRPAPFFTERKAVLFFLKDSAALFLSEPREETSPIPVMTQRFTGASGFFPDTGGPGRVGGHVAEGYEGRGIAERGGDAGGTAGAELHLDNIFFYTKGLVEDEPEPITGDTCDVNHDGEVGIADVTYLIEHVMTGGHTAPVE